MRGATGAVTPDHVVFDVNTNAASSMSAAPDAPPYRTAFSAFSPFPRLLKTAAAGVDELLGVRSLDDDLSAGWGGPDLATAITLLGKLTGKELVEFGVEETGLDDSANLGAALSLHC